MRTLFAFMLLLSFTEAGTIDPKSSDSAHVQYGRQFPYVLKIRCRNVETNVFQSASCVAIDPRWVITAAHVVAGCDKVSVDKGDTAITAEEVIIHPEFHEDKLGNSDLAICRLSGDVGLSFYPPLYGGSDEVGRTASMAGWGITGTFATGHQISDDKRRGGANMVSKAEAGVLVCLIGGDPNVQMEFCIAPGDSGGGLFIGNKLAGIHSFVSAHRRSPTSKYGEESSHTRISLHREWIRGYTDK
jgi:hypothetical protein